MDGPQERAQAGLRARDFRRRKNMTLEQVAAASGMSSGHLSRFERGEKSLSIASLMRLARALQTTVGHLLGEDGSAKDLHLVRAGEARSRSVEDGAGPYEFFLLSGSAADHVGHETFIVSIPRSSRRANSAFHSGHELLYLLSGSLRVQVGSHEVQLNPGDYLEFPGHYQHEIESIAELSEVLIIVFDGSRMS